MAYRGFESPPLRNIVLKRGSLKTELFEALFFYINNIKINFFCHPPIYDIIFNIIILNIRFTVFKKVIKRKNNKLAFTLIELLVVIAIIGLLATISIVALSNARSRARDARRLSDIKQLQTAIEMYYQYNGHYPRFSGGTGICSVNKYDSLLALISEGLMSKAPIDPKYNESNTPRLCYEYLGIGNHNDYSFSSSWYCNGKSRTDYQWSLLFSLEGNNSEFFRLTTSGGSINNGYKYCIHGPVRSGF
jgi:prepilin-type N-terminal cleavage/methylation domain-containing protein